MLLTFFPLFRLVGQHKLNLEACIRIDTLVLLDHFRCARSAAAVYNIWARCLWHVKDLFLVKVHVLKICARRLWSLDLPVFKSTGVNKGKAFQWIHQLTPS